MADCVTINVNVPPRWGTKEELDFIARLVERFPDHAHLYRSPIELDMGDSIHNQYAPPDKWACDPFNPTELELAMWRAAKARGTMGRVSPWHDGWMESGV